MNLRQQWPTLAPYRRFEIVVGLVLRVVISLAILVALFRLIVNVLDTLVLRSLNPLEHQVFQGVFGSIMTLLIALEFNHTLDSVIRRQIGIIQARTVIAIALLALARKVIVLELYVTSPATIAALAALTLALGITYRLMRPRAAEVRNVARTSDEPL